MGIGNTYIHTHTHTHKCWGISYAISFAEEETMKKRINFVIFVLGMKGIHKMSRVNDDDDDDDDDQIALRPPSPIAGEGTLYINIYMYKRGLWCGGFLLKYY